MIPDFLDPVDWDRPWLRPFFPLAAQIAAADWRQSLSAMAAQQDLKNHRGLPVRFVPQTDLPPGTPYELFISTTGAVPTRSNLHDFFNALVWLTFPRIKVRLNALQASEIQKTGTGNTSSRRGMVRDAATIFDENGALIVARDQGFIDALREHRWRQIFIEHREGLGKEWEVWLFGHAVMEKLVRPYKAITAHALPLVVNESFFSMSTQDKLSWMDGTAVGMMERSLSVAGLTPLPLLGVPDWWSGQDDTFYADAAVFRPSRLRCSK